MEEDKDIKILEEYLDKQDRKFVSEYRLMILQAIENLIARYKELDSENEVLEEIKTSYEKKQDKMLKENANLRDTNKKLYELAQHSAMQEFINEDCILKSKLKDWIEQKRDYFDKELQKANSNKNEEIKERIWCASAILEDLEQDFLED